MGGEGRRLSQPRLFTLGPRRDLRELPAAKWDARLDSFLRPGKDSVRFVCDFTGRAALLPALADSQ